MASVRSQAVIELKNAQAIVIGARRHQPVAGATLLLETVLPRSEYQLLRTVGAEAAIGFYLILRFVAAVLFPTSIGGTILNKRLIGL